MDIKSDVFCGSRFYPNGFVSRQLFYRIHKTAMKRYSGWFCLSLTAIQISPG